MRVGDLIRLDLEDIVAEWTAEARREVAGAERKPPLSLVDNLPELLHELAAWLNDELEARSEHQCYEVARKHALHCLRQELALDEVVHEYRILRRVLVRRLVEVAVQQPLEALEDVQRLHEALDAAISVAVDQFTRERERTLLAEGERSRLALDAGALGMWEWFPRAGRLEWDRRSRELFGVGPDTRVDYATFLEAIRPDDRDRVDALVREKVGSSSAGDELLVEYRVVVGTPGERWFESRGRVLERDETGHAGRFLGTVMDVTERKRRERELEQIAVFRERFLAILGHDLRNPLQAARMTATSLLNSPELPPSLVKSAERIVSSGDRMARMISDLLDLARGRLGGGIPVAPQRADLREIAAGIRETQELSHPGRQIVCEEHGRLDGEWDPDRVAQALGNLVANALDHGDPDTPVRVELLDEGERVAVVVHNEGPPIPSEMQARIFEPFRAGPHRGSGLGLGLYIANEIVRAHHGSIAVTSGAREGTTFRMTLPRAA